MNSSPGDPPANRTEAFVDSILRFRWPILAMVLLISILALLGTSRVGVDNAVEIWFVDDDPALAAYYEFQETFGNDEVVVMAIYQQGGILNPEGMERIQAVGQAALSVDGISRVDSLATVESISSGQDWLEVAPLYQPPLEPDFARRVLSDPLYAGKLVNKAGDTALVLARMASMDDIDAQRYSILAELREAVGATDESVAYAGIGVIYAALNQLSTVDSTGFIAGSYVVIVLLLMLLLRRTGPVLLTMAVVGVAALWLMGVYGATGHDINMVTLILPTLMLIIGVSDCIHFLNRSVELPRQGTRWVRARSAVAFMFWPCLMNSLTTAAGFASLSMAPMPVVRDLGSFAAIGVLGAFVAALLGTSIGLLWGWTEPASSPPRFLERIVETMSSLASRRPAAILVAVLVAVLLGALGATNLEVDTYSIDYLRASHPVRQDSDRIEATFGNYTPLEFVVESPDLMSDPALLAAVAAWQDRMLEDPRVSWTRSVVDIVRKMEQVLGDGLPESYRVPGDPARLEQAMFLYTSDPDSDLSTLVSADGNRLRVTAGIPMSSARVIGQTLDDLLAMARLPQNASITPGGYLPLYVRIMEEVVSSQISSFSMAFLVIFVMLAMLFRSWRLAALAIPPNIVPIVLILGVMGATGIRLDVATVTISAVLLGLVVDDTTQLLYRFRHEMRRLGDHRKAVQAAIRGVGRALVGTTMVLALGFLVLAFAHVKSISWFGLLMSLALVTALLGDLLMLPAMIVLFKPRIR